MPCLIHDFNNRDRKCSRCGIPKKLVNILSGPYAREFIEDNRREYLEKRGVSVFYAFLENPFERR